MVAIVTGPTNGSALLGPASVFYVPTAGFVGVDTFTYRISDGRGETDGKICVGFDPVDILLSLSTTGSWS